MLFRRIQVKACDTMFQNIQIKTEPSCISMKRCGFAGRNINPADVVERIKDVMGRNDFSVVSAIHSGNVWDLRFARKSQSKFEAGDVRDADAVVSGSIERFQVTFKVGVWGRDMPLPLLEGVATLGIATAKELRFSHELEMKIWKEIVHSVDPGLFVCDRCGMVLKTEKELKGHMEFEKHHYINNLALGARMGLEEIQEYGPEGFDEMFYV